MVFISQVFARNPDPELEMTFSLLIDDVVHILRTRPLTNDEEGLLFYTEERFPGVGKMIVQSPMSIQLNPHNFDIIVTWVNPLERKLYGLPTWMKLRFHGPLLPSKEEPLDVAWEQLRRSGDMDMTVTYVTGSHGECIDYTLPQLGNP